HVVGAEAGEHAAHGVEELGPLILAQVRTAEAGEIGLALLDDLRGLLTARFNADEGFLLLLAVERTVELIEEKALIPEGIALMVFRLAEGLGKIPVKDGLASEAEPFVGMGVAPAGDMVASIDEFEVLVRRSSEETDRGRILDVPHEILLHLPGHLVA